MTEYDFFILFDKFIKATQTGKRTQKNGKRIGKNTIDTYQTIRNSLFDFTISNSLPLRIRPVARLSKTEWIKEKKYWNKFYVKYHVQLLKKGFTDNYIGLHFKNIKTFFGYIEDTLLPSIRQVCKSFHVPKDEIPVVVLLPEQLSFLINNLEFEESLSQKQKQTKDFFVFGCTVALRFSDLLRLKKSNLIKTNSACYLRITSQKTETATQIKLPDYALKILDRNKVKNKYLLPRTSLTDFNTNIRELIELAGWKEESPKIRRRNGKMIEIKTKKNKSMRFCDQMSSHVMRRTAITTMLILGVPEQVVRKISGHAASSREFYKYVNFSKAFQDQETDMMFNRLISIK